MATITGRLQIRRDTAANFTSNDPTLAAGEWGYETDTGVLKIGDGSTAWTSLGGVDTRSAINGATGKTTPVNADTFALIDSAASNVLKKLTWANLVATVQAAIASATVTLTNKTLTAPVLGGTVTGTYTLGGSPTFPSSVSTLTGTQTLTNKTLIDPKIVHSVNAQTGTTYTLVLTDNTKKITMNNASANTLTIPANASVAFPVGTIIGITQIGAGATTIEGDTGVTLNGVSAGSAAIAAQWSGATITKIATDAWIMEGNHGAVT